MKNLYPVTIVKTRYGGAYEGGQWAAFEDYEWALPPEAFSDDTTCARWWSDSNNNKFVGIGNTPTEAYNDLYHNKS